MNGRKVIATNIGSFIVLFHVCFHGICGGFSILANVLAGLSDVPSGAVCLSASQVLAFGQAAVRLERRHHRDDERSLLKREFRFYLE